MNFLRRAVVVCAVASSPRVLPAQDQPYAPLILRLPVSARALGMGNVAILGRDDDVLFANPAQLVNATGLSVSSERLSPSAHSAAFSSVIRFNGGGLAIGATAAAFRGHSGLYPVDRGAMLESGDNAGTSASIVLGAAQAIKGTRIGVAVKYVDERIGIATNGRGLIDLGVARDFFGYGFGLSAQNLGRDFAPTRPNSFTNVGFKTDVPLRVTLGTARGTPAGPFDILGTAAVSVLRDGFVTPAAGGEIGYSWLSGYNVILRAGARRPELGERALTAGAGLIVDRLSVDYALETLAGSHIGQRLGLRIR
jgi:hypothetical protein